MGCSSLKQITIFTCEEKRIEHYDNKILVFKINLNNKDYNEIILANHELVIPSFIKTIGHSSF